MSFLGGVVEELPDRIAPARVLVRGGLVGKQNRGCESKRSGKCGSLLLADRGLARQPICELVEAEPCEQLLDPRPMELWLTRQPGGQVDVLAYRELGQEAEPLRENCELVPAEPRGPDAAPA